MLAKAVIEELGASWTLVAEHIVAATKVWSLPLLAF